MGWEKIETDSDRYPQLVLGTVARPTSLYVDGASELLHKRAVGICGSRSASDSALRYAREFGAASAEAGFVVVSGHAKGIDRAAHVGALGAGGNTIAVLPEGLDHFRLAAELRPLVTARNFVAVSQFPPNTPWAAFRAMQRNRYIVGLSRGLFVVEARERGGTFEAGLECLRQRKPLWVIDYATKDEGRTGNLALIRRGGIAIRTVRQLKRVLAEQPSTWASSSSSQHALAI